MKFFALALAALTLAGCNRASNNNDDAVRQGVIDYLATRSNLNVSSMDVKIEKVTYTGNEADAAVAFAAKGSTAPGQGMTMHYTLERQGTRWVVKGKSGSGGSNPHGGGMPEAAPGTMPGAPPSGEAPGGSLPPGHPSVGKQPTEKK